MADVVSDPHPAAQPHIAPPLPSVEWKARAEAYLERVHRWTLPYKKRRSRQEAHPVHDFLFQYYMYSPGKLERWHPSPSESLVDSPEAREHFTPPEYLAAEGVLQRDPTGLTPNARADLEEARGVLVATRGRPPNFGCYGVHEWAMVYGGHDLRHVGIAPLRLPQDEVNAFVEAQPVACSHFEAFRFFAPDAKPMNRIPLEWSTRHDVEQPGCIHANMDLYRWAYSSMPWIGSDALLACFELAVELRVLDMQASPYDLRHFGFEPVAIETVEGRSEYQRRQKELSRKASVLREDLIGLLEGVLAVPVLTV